MALCQNNKFVHYLMAKIFINLTTVQSLGHPHWPAIRPSNHDYTTYRLSIPQSLLWLFIFVPSRSVMYVLGDGLWEEYVGFYVAGESEFEAKEGRLQPCAVKFNTTPQPGFMALPASLLSSPLLSSPLLASPRCISKTEIKPSNVSSHPKRMTPSYVTRPPLLSQ